MYVKYYYVFQLQGGGDMAALRHFSTGAVRQGFVVDDVSAIF